MNEKKNVWRNLFSRKPKDERVTAEINRIYRVGFLILSLGILLDIYLQLASTGEVRLVEFGVFMFAQVVCIVLMVRKGMMDDSRYAEADVFPKKHYLLLGLGAGAAAGLLLTVLRAMFVQWEWGTKLFWATQGIMFVSCVVLVTALVYPVQYLVFRIAKRRRSRAQDTDEMKL